MTESADTGDKRSKKEDLANEQVVGNWGKEEGDTGGNKPKGCLSLKLSLARSFLVEMVAMEERRTYNFTRASL